jgi:hypothetical protein
MIAYRMRNRDMAQVEMTVTVPHIFTFRLWLGMLLLRLAVRITGLSLKITREP